ncbi:MAG: hypothetical protein WD557_12100 [Dehalococcoidia bacterium]
MAPKLLWKLASPYDAYVSHVAELNHAIERIKFLSGMALGYEAGLQGSIRLVPGTPDAAARARGFRARLGEAAASMTDEQFEEFIAHLGGGDVADVEADRAQAVSRLSYTTRGLEEYFATAGQALALLEERGYAPSRADVARQLRDNNLPPNTIADYRRELHELGAKVSMGNGKGP